MSREFNQTTKCLALVLKSGGFCSTLNHMDLAHTNVITICALGFREHCCCALSANNRTHRSTLSFQNWWVRCQRSQRQKMWPPSTILLLCTWGVHKLGSSIRRELDHHDVDSLAATPFRAIMMATPLTASTLHFDLVRAFQQ